MADAEGSAAVLQAPAEAAPVAAAEPAAVPQATFEATPAAAEVVPAAAAAPEAAAAPAPSKQMLDKLRKQIEYYFGDANFRNDKFLKGKANEDADGFVGLSVLLTFNRIKALGVGVPVMAAALEDSSELELSDDKLAIRRTRPLPADDDSDSRCIYAKAPFPATTTLEELYAFFGEHGDVRRIYMRRMRSREKTFKGSVFVEYGTIAEAASFVARAATLKKHGAAAAASATAAASSASSSSSSAVPAAPEGSSSSSTAEEAAAPAVAAAAAAVPETAAPVAAAAPAPAITWKGAPLLNVETKISYGARKRLEWLARREKKLVAKSAGGGKGGKKAAPSSSSSSAAPTAAAAAGGDDEAGDDDEEVAGDDEAAGDGAADASGDAAAAASSAMGSKRPRAEEGGKPAFVRTLVPGLVLKVTGIGPSASRDSLNNYANALGHSVKFIEMAPTHAFMRFASVEAAAAVAGDLSKEGNANAQKATGGETPAAAVIAGDEEKSYWERVWVAQEARNSANGGGGRGGRGRGGGGGRGRGGRGGRGGGGFGGRGGGRGGRGRGGGRGGGGRGGGGRGGKRDRDGGSSGGGGGPAKRSKGGDE